MKLMVITLLSLVPPLFAQNGIPSRTLPEVGCGPALLIGVKDYDQKGSVFDPLPGITQDLERMEATVRKLGFTDVVVLTDPSKDEMLDAMNTFGRKITTSAKTSFFYYSGHGVLQDKMNYLIPARAPVMARGHLENYAVPLEHVTGFIGADTAGPCLFFVDACRNNSLPAGTKSSADGSLLVQRKGGMFVGFATAAGKTSAASLTGSPYTESLSRHLLLRDASLDDLYFNVIGDVESATKDDPDNFQPPEKASGLRYRFVLVPGKGALPEPSGLFSKITRGSPLTNSLGMKFVPAGTPGVLFCKWETRLGDFKAFVDATGYDAISESEQGWLPVTIEEEGQGKRVGGSWKNPRFPAAASQTDEHPVTCVSFLDAEAFCAWLTKNERDAGRIPPTASYRLPTDAEWSRACGDGKYPWGDSYPPKNSEGNFWGKEAMIGTLTGRETALSKIGFDDDAPRTSPVGKYAENELGLADMGGNVYEWCSTVYNRALNAADVLEAFPQLNSDENQNSCHVLRGASWMEYSEMDLRSSFRSLGAPRGRIVALGFRCVLAE